MMNNSLSKSTFRSSWTEKHYDFARHWRSYGHKSDMRKSCAIMGRNSLIHAGGYRPKYHWSRDDTFYYYYYTYGSLTAY